MTPHTLLLRGERRGRLSTHEFLWHEATPASSSFLTNLDPHGRPLAPRHASVVDLLRVAVLVYLADRTTPRPARGWDREFELEVPVSDPDRWNERAGGIAGLLDFMTGDTWTLGFRYGRVTLPRQRRDAPSFPLACLFSGGADSFGGAARAKSADTPTLLVSHWDSTLTRSAQIEAERALVRLPGGRVTGTALELRRRKEQPRGEEFKTESTSRSRSLVFLALGVAAASSVQATNLLVPENGWVSINPPLGGDRRASLSTRTTHPALLDEWSRVVRDLGVNVGIVNPWEGMTKGELFGWVREQYGADDASRSLSVTHSCARTDARWEGFRPRTHCGVCFACLVRRGAFLAAELVDRTTYIEVELRQDHDRRAEWFSAERRRDLVSVRTAIARGGFAIDDVLALDLPTRMSPDSALDLANRGLAELRAVEVP